MGRKGYWYVLLVHRLLGSFADPHGCIDLKRLDSCDASRLCSLSSGSGSLRCPVCIVRDHALVLRCSHADSLPVSRHFSKTYALALLLSILTVYPSVYTLRLPSVSEAHRFTWLRLFAELS